MPKMKMKKAVSVDAYIKDAPKPAQPMLRQLRKIVKSTAPKAVEGIGYGMPYYKERGQMLVSFAAFKAHVSFFPMTSSLLKNYSEAKKYQTSTGTMQFPYRKPVPDKLVAKLIRGRMKMNDVRLKVKKTMYL